MRRLSPFRGAQLAPALASLLLAGCVSANRTEQSPTPTAASAVQSVPPGTRYVAAATPEAAGEYLTIVGGCNDCHTAAWSESNGNVAPAERLTGNPVGYRGPWGTTYAPNLRRVVQFLSEDRWVHTLKTAAGGHGRPPMPWMNTALMSDKDLRAIYTYIHALGPAGTRMPRSLPPGKEPTTPYVNFTPQTPGQ